MRETWLGNGNKVYPWHLNGAFKDPALGVQTDLNKHPQRYQAHIVGMVGLDYSSANRRQASPRKLAEDMSSRRTIIPDHPEHPVVRSQPQIVNKRRFHTPIGKPNLVDMIQSSPAEVPRRSTKQATSPVTWNSPTGDNPVVSPTLRPAYRTPPPPARSSSAGKRLGEFSSHYKESQVTTLPGPAVAKQTPPTPPKYKPEFFSQVACLPGTLRTHVPKPRPGTLDKEMRRNLLTSPHRDMIVTSGNSPARGKKGYPGQEMWRSSYDILKDALKTVKL